MRFQMNAVRVVVCAMIVTMLVGATARAQESASCLEGIEKWMRGCQARAWQMQNRLIIWPGCCSNGSAPLFPPDGYYRDALKDNPQLAVKLVETCRGELNRVPVSPQTFTVLATHFLDIADNVNSLDGLEIQSIEHHVASDMESKTMTVSESNFCAVYAVLKTDLKKLRAVLAGDVGYDNDAQTNAVSGSDATHQYCANHAACNADAATACDAAKAQAAGCWGGSNWVEGSGSAPNVREEASRTVSGADTCWFFSVSAHKATIHADLSRFGLTGVAKVYVAGRKECGGAGTPADCVINPENFEGWQTDPQLPQIPLKWHQFASGGVINLPRGAAWDSGLMGNLSSPPFTYSETDPPNCDSGESWATGTRGWSVWNTEALVLLDWDSAPPDFGKKCGDDCGQCVPGQPQVVIGGTGREGTPDVGGVVYWPLGKVVDGHSAGYVQVFSTNIVADAVTVENVIANLPEASVSEVATATARQFITPYVIADVRAATSATGVALNFYHKADATAPTGGSTLWTFSGATAFATSTVTYSTAGVFQPTAPTTSSSVSGAKFSIEATGVGGGTWEISQVGNDWLLRSGIVSGAATSLETRIRGTSGDDKTVTRQILQPNGTVVLQGVEVWREFAWGQEVIARTLGTTGSGGTLTTERSFYTTSGTGTIAGRLEQETDPYGNWRHYSYDDYGRITKIDSPFQDSLYAGGDDYFRRDAHGYFSIDVDQSGVADAVEEIVEYVKKVPVTRTYLIQFAGSASRVNGWSGQRQWTIRCASTGQPSNLTTYLQGVWSAQMGTGSGQGWGAGSDDVSESIREADYPFRTLSSVRHDGTLTWTLYADSPVSNSFFSFPSGATTGVVSCTGRMGPTSNPWVSGGTRRTTYRNAQGTVMLSQVTDLASGAVVSSSSTIPSGGSTPYLDEFGRATRVYDLLTGRYSSTAYSCCGIESQTDEHGVKTFYEYDALKRMTKVSTQVDVSGGTPLTIKSITEYDAAGRVVATKRQGTDNGTPEIVTSSVYDLAGRLISSDNFEGAAGRTTYSESYNSSTGLTTRTETLPDPDGSGGVAAPRNVRMYHRDGSLAKVNVPFYDDSSSTPSASAPEQHEQGTYTDPGTGTVYSWTQRFATSASSPSAPYSKTFVDPLGHTKWVQQSLPSSAIATTEIHQSDHDRASTQTDPDGVKTITVRGSGTDQATYNSEPIFSGGVPSGLSEYFSGQWTLTVRKVNTSGGITVSATGSAPADRMTLSSSWIGTPTLGSTATAVRISATIAWADNGSASTVIETSRTETTLDGADSRTGSFGRGTTTQSVVGTGGTVDGTTTTTTIDRTGASTIAKTEWGRQTSVVRKNTSAGVIAETDLVYDTMNRLIHSYLWRTESHTNTADRDATDFTYVAGSDRVHTRVDPSPSTGTSTSDRTTTTYTYDHLGRTTAVVLTGDKATTTTYTARGQVATVRGFGVNPVDYGYDEQGRMVTLTTYTDASSSAGAATTTWVYDSASGRLTSKSYEGSASPDLSYTYTAAGRLLTRAGKRFTTTYTYRDVTRDLYQITYSDSGATPVWYTAYDRLGRVTQIIDAAGQHALAYINDGRLSSDSVTSDSEVSGAPHLNLLAGFSSASTFGTPVTGGGSLRTLHEAANNSNTINSVEFEYAADARMSRVKKSGADALYTYEPVTGQVASVTNRRFTGGTTWAGRMYSPRTYDRLGRLTDISSNNAAVSATLTDRGYTMDAYGRRITMQAAGQDAKDENWSYEYDDLGQLTIGTARFEDMATEIPGSYYGYTYDDIGNRTRVEQGDIDTNGVYDVGYTPNALNQYTARDNSGLLEVSGFSPAAAVYVYTGSTPGDAAYRNPDADGFFHQRLDLDAGNTPHKETIKVSEVVGDLTTFDALVPYKNETFTYDDDGNLTQDGIWTYTWDAENRLVAMQLNSDIGTLLLGRDDYWLRLEFAYDHMGRRISKRFLRISNDPTQVSGKDISYEWKSSYWQKFIYDVGSWNLSAVARCDAETGAYTEPEQTFAWGPDLSATEQGAGGIGGLAIYLDDWYDLHTSSTAIGPMFPAYDGNGNIVKLFDASANGGGTGIPKQVGAWKYGPFGEDRGRQGPVEASRFPFRWSTKYTDNETGLVYYGYRYYSAGLGRWISRDPLMERGSLAIYGMLGNNPVSRADYLGNIDWEWLNRLRGILKQLVTDSITGGAETLYQFIQDHPLSADEIAQINSVLPSIKSAANQVVNTNPKTMNWLDLALAWFFELGREVYMFGPGDYTTESLRVHEGVNDARKLAHDDCLKGNHRVVHQWPFGVDQFWQSISTVAVASEFLGTYAIEVTSDTCCDSFHFHAFNSSSWESATRFRRGEVPGGEHRGILPSRKRGDPGIQLGGTIEEHWEWDEDAGGREK